ncbi:MAG TPA: adenylate/guanylate cyclase domain-containing protein [Vicinamibacterales bacterium]|nr:adenylate/guanylate cyclase domain-containing protein [Vicinamibacterales bacterium]
MRRIAAGIALGVAAASLVLALGVLGWLDTAELKTYDWRLRRAANPASAHPGIVLVEINDASIRDLAPLVGRWPWPRALHALLVDYLHRGSPRAIALDIGFWEREREATYPFLGEAMTSSRSDQALADASRRAGNVILLADAVDPGLIGAEVPQASWPAPPYRLGPAIEERPVIKLPYDSLADAAAGFGHNFLALDPDGPARRIVPFVRSGDRYMPSLGMAAALAAGGYAPGEVVLEESAIRIRDGRVPLVPIEVPGATDSSTRQQQTMLIDYRAAAGGGGARPYVSYEASHLLQSEGKILSGEKPDIDPAVFKDKIVFVGLTASGLLDAFQTPLGEGTLAGIDLHASVADSVLSNRFLSHAPGWSAVAATAGGAILIGLMSAALPFAAAAGGSALLAGAWLALSVYAMTRGLSVALVQPLLVMAVALFAGTAYRYFVEDAERRKVSRLFGRYVSRDVYDQLMADPGLAELGGRRRDMTVLFCDIRGFTSVTEKGDPEALVSQLNEYFSRMVEVVFRHGGTVDKFVGDLVMALFGAPVDDAGHAEHAVAAAVDMVRELEQLNRKWAVEGRPALDIGIGINSGEMIAGNIGSSAIMSYTAIGDNVNLGSRLESLNKEYRTRVIISEATRRRLRGGCDIRPLGRVVVKGRTQPVDIFEVSVPSPLPAEPRAAGQASAEEGAP